MRHSWQTWKVRRSSASRSRASQYLGSRGLHSGGAAGLLAGTSFMSRARTRETFRISIVERLGSLVEPARMRLFGLRQGLEPVRDLGEALFARGLRHAGIHGLVFVRLAGNGGFQILQRRADRQARRRVAHLLQKLEMAVCVARFAVRRVLEQTGDLRVALYVGNLREIKIAAVRLGLARERVLQVLVRLRSFELRHDHSSRFT